MSPQPGMVLDTFKGLLHVPVELQDDYPERFFWWVKDNMHVYKAFVERALDHKAWGRERYGAKKICEEIRWDTTTRERGKPLFKVNNNYVSGLSRLAQFQFPELRGFFVCRDRSGNDVKQEKAA